MQAGGEVLEILATQRDLATIAGDCSNGRDRTGTRRCMDRFESGNTERCSRKQRRLHEIATLHGSLPALLECAPVEARAGAKASDESVVAEGTRGTGISLAETQRRGEDQNRSGNAQNPRLLLLVFFSFFPAS